MNPDHKVTPGGGCQCLKEPPGARIGLERLGDVGRQIGDRRPRRVRVTGWSRSRASRHEQAGRFELSPTLAIDVGPFACGLPRCELEGVAIVVETSYEAVDPSEAQRLSNRVLVRD